MERNGEESLQRMPQRDAACEQARGPILGLLKVWKRSPSITFSLLFVYNDAGVSELFGDDEDTLG